MADNNDSDIGAFLTGFVVGGLVGAAVALILAPQSGAETREQIRMKGIELKERGEETLTVTATPRSNPPEGQGAIAAYQVNGKQLFFPNAEKKAS